MSYAQMYKTVAETIRDMRGFSPEQKHAIAAQFAMKFRSHGNFDPYAFFRDCGVEL